MQLVWLEFVCIVFWTFAATHINPMENAEEEIPHDQLPTCPYGIRESATSKGFALYEISATDQLLKTYYRNSTYKAEIRQIRRLENYCKTAEHPHHARITTNHKVCAWHDRNNTPLYGILMERTMKFDYKLEGPLIIRCMRDLLTSLETLAHVGIAISELHYESFRMRYGWLLFAFSYDSDFIGGLLTRSPEKLLNAGNIHINVGKTGTWFAGLVFFRLLTRTKLTERNFHVLRPYTRYFWRARHELSNQEAIDLQWFVYFMRSRQLGREIIGEEEQRMHISFGRQLGTDLYTSFRYRLNNTHKPNSVALATQMLAFEPEDRPTMIEAIRQFNRMNELT